MQLKFPYSSSSSRQTSKLLNFRDISLYFWKHWSDRNSLKKQFACSGIGIIVVCFNPFVSSHALPTPNTDLTLSDPPLLFAQQSSPWGPRHSGKVAGADSRDDCPEVPVPFIALLPDTHLGKTTDSTPTLWFYSPYNAGDIQYGELMIQNEQEYQVINPIQFDVPDTPGFFSLTLPDLSSAIETGTAYNWFVELYCTEDSWTPITTEGWIQYIEAPTLLNVSSTYQDYWDNHVWFDAIDSLTQQRFAQPSNQATDADWLAILNEVGLDENYLAHLSTASLIENIQLEYQN